ncbi:hypothetical protein [Eleftheria terrae]|uniref:hypothetical protein n=1 Tax=Eleftheria terrae TaxID=1597781 RepID=UPI00263AA3C5|nr:hypothetical protein [Eleftheria terrae]WKB52931.1 hypothetical protein N7L95_00580 [Eleftheria terrae]
MHRDNRATFLVLIESGGPMEALLFDAERRLVAEIDATSEEVGVMTAGLTPERAGADEAWRQALRGHSAEERAQALIYRLAL